MDIIISWNIRHGGGGRITKIIDVLKKHNDASIIVLSEFRKNENSESIQCALTNLGFVHQYTATDDPKKNSVLIACKELFQSETFPHLKEHSQRVIKISNKNFSLYGCYFPLQDAKKFVFDFLLNEVTTNPDEKIIITGDLNTGKHFIDEKDATFFHSHYLNKLEQENLFDAWRYFHKDKKEFTWFSNSKNGFRLDHFFVHNELKKNVKRCDYIHEYREHKITDHSMMLLELTD